jgi:transposase-like protein
VYSPDGCFATVSRFKTIWQQEFEQWQKRGLEGKFYVYFWVDGIYCILVIMGATADGVKELVALEGGSRESELS